MIRKLCYPEISIDRSGDELFYDLFQSYFDMFQPSSLSSSSSSIYSESKISCSLLLLQQLIHDKDIDIVNVIVILTDTVT